ncbi:DUF2799 domain-containing protein [Abyssibius alkaniclasticus]|uniref:DUF2799 domain-containing protein n=1 Tax=Abyssibius alkaniclasticus TaxID=2881234 RepID=UPI00236456F4|nr:DUF2799 domain-containing protein [Abyssibius alkaniclasticus]UPH71714.1 DUF2799 domain-containing protein [Abyssibius alkaniclasticus]
MSIRFATGFLTLAFGLSACASLTPQQCATGNWAEIGFADGAAGRAPSYINAHRDACGELGITPDLAAWTSGRNAGLVQYCSPENAYRLGRDGRDVSPVCTPQQRDNMRYAYNWGLDYYEFEQEIDDARRDISRLRAEIQTILLNPTPTPEELLLIEQLEARISNKQRDIRRLELRQRRYARPPF